MKLISVERTVLIDLRLYPTPEILVTSLGRSRRWISRNFNVCVPMIYGLKYELCTLLPNSLDPWQCLGLYAGIGCTSICHDDITVASMRQHLWKLGVTGLVCR